MAQTTVWENYIKAFSLVRKVPRTVVKDTDHYCPFLPHSSRAWDVPTSGARVVLTPPHKICVLLRWLNHSISPSREQALTIGIYMMSGD